MLNVVQHQGHQHVLMEAGARLHMDIDQEIRDVKDVRRQHIHIEIVVTRFQRCLTDEARQ